MKRLARSLLVAVSVFSVAQAASASRTFRTVDPSICLDAQTAADTARQDLIARGVNSAEEVAEHFAYALYDRKNQAFIASYNLDKPALIMSTAKLATAAAVAKYAPALSAEQAASVARMLRISSNQHAIAWMRAAVAAKNNQTSEDWKKPKSELYECYNNAGAPGGRRSQAQIDDDLKNASAYFNDLKAAYPDIDWTAPQAMLATGAGCARHEDAKDMMSARQFMAVLDDLSDARFGDWSVADTLMNFDASGEAAPPRNEMARRCPFNAPDRCERFGSEAIYAKTGSDEDVENLAGYIKGGDDPYRYYFVIFMGESREQHAACTNSEGRATSGVCGGSAFQRDLLKGWSAALKACESR